MKVSAVQAAQLIGRNERRIRDWIATQRLPAVKVGQSWQIDTEDLERLPGVRIDSEQLAFLQAQESGMPHRLASRVAELERLVQDLRDETALLHARISLIERQQFGRAHGEPALDVPRAGENQPHSQVAYLPANRRSMFPLAEGQGGEELPPGSMRMKQFALLHKVPAAVLIYQIETGKIEDTAVSMASGRKAHWLTPQQQGAIIAFWRRNSTHFVPCPGCPHQ